MNKKFSEKLQDKYIPIPTNAADKRRSALFCADGQPGMKASSYLLSLSFEFIKNMHATDLSAVSNRIKPTQVNYIDIFPGEHYKLLAAIVKTMRPKTIVELGTHLGYSALCMKQELPADGTIHTFDVIPWNGFEDTILEQNDFDTQLVQHIADITDAKIFADHLPLLENADIIFMDALKDGVQEYQFLENFSKVKFRNKCLFVLDDIRLWNMLDIWYNIDKPKFDLTSYGHWSGTGLIEWN